MSIPPPTTPVLQETMTSSPTVAEQPSVGLSIKEVQSYQRILYKLYICVFYREVDKCICKSLVVV